MIKQLIQEQFIPGSPEDIWRFFATPKNLNFVTPPEMDFKILTSIPDKMYRGMIISYKIKPIFNIYIEWVTEITHIRENEYFVDNQIKGPYRIWHHEHHFKIVEGGVLMTDILYYDIGKSFLGWIAGELFVHRKVKEIFKYREGAIKNYFEISVS